MRCLQPRPFNNIFSRMRFFAAELLINAHVDRISEVTKNVSGKRDIDRVFILVSKINMHGAFSCGVGHRGDALYAAVPVLSRNTSRGFAPRTGPMSPFFSIMSRSFAALA